MLPLAHTANIYIYKYIYKNKIKTMVTISNCVANKVLLKL